MKVIFAVYHADYREVEWILPILHNYRKRRVHVTVFLSVFPKTKRQKIIAAWIGKYSDKIIYICDILYGEGTFFSKLCVKSEVKKCKFNKIIRAFFYPSTKKINLIDISPLLRRIILRKISNLLYGVSVVYVPHGRLRGKNKYSIVSILCKKARFLGVPLAVYTYSVYSEPKTMAAKNKGAACILVKSHYEERECNKLGLTAVATGAQRFSNHWIEELVNYYGQLENVLCKEKFPEQPVVLVLLKNETGMIEGEQVARVRFKLRQRLFSKLLDEGFFLLIKPHPGQKEALLARDLKNLPQNTYHVCQDAIPYLASISDCCVVELPTNSAMDCFALRKKVFWMYPLLKKEINIKNKDLIIDNFDSNPSLNAFFQFVEVGVPKITDKNNLSLGKYKKIREFMSLDINIENAIKRCESVVASQKRVAK